MMNLLIILGCLVGGYWLVSSIMSPGVDLTRTTRPGEKPAEPASDTRSVTGADPGTDAHRHDWHLILDIPANANRREIEHAFKRRLAKAESAGDSIESQRIRAAYAAGLRQAGR